ncbi:hypothetical protein EDD15DRAFT_1305921 [Pisolithus albus]|nr:hypothetical protein EDD15DRAFT_1305921 [Pisolithus albus]
MLGADADRRSGEEKEGGKDGSQVETVDSMLGESAGRQKQPGVSLYEDLRTPSRECRNGDHYSKGLWSDDGFEEFMREPRELALRRCYRTSRPYKRSRRSGKANEIEKYSSHKTRDNSDTAHLSVPNQPVMGSSRTARDNITSNVTAVDKNPVDFRR